MRRREAAWQTAHGRAVASRCRPLPHPLRSWSHGTSARTAHRTMQLAAHSAPHRPKCKCIPCCSVRLYIRGCLCTSNHTFVQPTTARRKKVLRCISAHSVKKEYCAVVFNKLRSMTHQNVHGWPMLSKAHHDLPARPRAHRNLEPKATNLNLKKKKK